jgi:hypothetical protein
VTVPVIIRVVMTPIPVFRLLLAFEMGEVTILAVIFSRPLLVIPVFAIIPVVVILMVSVVVPPLILVVSVPMSVVLMVIVLEIGAC